MNYQKNPKPKQTQTTPPKWPEEKFELLPFNFSLILLQAILIPEKRIETKLPVWLVSSVIINLQ